MMIAHRGSIAERGGCFQRRLFVCLTFCLSVCQHDNFRTIKRRMMKLRGYVHCTKISPEFERQRSKVKVTGDKTTKKFGIFFVSRRSSSAARSSCGIFLGSGTRERGLRGGLCACRFYAGGKISACRLVIVSNRQATT